jgi:hypothetical protein
MGRDSTGLLLGLSFSTGTNTLDSQPDKGEHDGGYTDEEEETACMRVRVRVGGRVHSFGATPGS